MEVNELLTSCCKDIELLAWSDWKPMHEPVSIRGKGFSSYEGIGVYQLKNIRLSTYILVGTGLNCKKRMKTLYPSPFGTGTRNNKEKVKYVYENWPDIHFRTLNTGTIRNAEFIEAALLAVENHMFNS